MSLCSVARFFALFLFSASVFANQPQCEDALTRTEKTFESSIVYHRGQPLTVHQITGAFVTSLHSSVVAPEIPNKEKIVVGFDKGHVYIYHQGQKADSWGKPPFKVDAIPRKGHQLTGQLLLVLHDQVGGLSERFASAMSLFEGTSDRTCIRLMSAFLEDLYSDGMVRCRALNTQLFFWKLVQLQETGAFSAQAYVIGTDSLENALKAQWINQLKTTRNALESIGVPPGLVNRLGRILFGEAYGN
jgi:hypothetical protein